MRHHIRHDGNYHPRAYCEISHLLLEGWRQTHRRLVIYLGPSPEDSPTSRASETQWPKCASQRNALRHPIVSWVGVEVKMFTPPKKGKDLHDIHMQWRLYTRGQTVSILGLHQAWLPCRVILQQLSQKHFWKEGAWQWGEIIDCKIKGALEGERLESIDCSFRK